jgi:hypothetical protein
MAYLSVHFNEERKNVEVKIKIPLILSKVFSRLYCGWRRRSGRPPFGGEDFLLSQHARRDLGLPEPLSPREQVLIRHPLRFG